MPDLDMWALATGAAAAALLVIMLMLAGIQRGIRRIRTRRTWTAEDERLRMIEGRAEQITRERIYFERVYDIVTGGGR